MVAARRTAATNVRNKLANIKRANQARAKIKKAVTELLAAGKPLRVAELIKAAGVSPTTLYKHHDLWRHHYEKTDLAGFIGVYSVGCGGIRDLEAASTSPEQKKEPEGLLAARQIAFEIQSRLDRNKRRQEKSVSMEFARIEQK